MSDDTRTASFERLNDVNYSRWVLRMEAILIRKGLWSVVEVTVNKTGKDAPTIAKEEDELKGKQDGQKMAEARAEMVLRVEDGQLSHMRAKDPMEIWATLRRVHQAAGFATSLALRRKFLTAKKNNFEAMQAWIGRIRALAFCLEEAGIVVLEQDIILSLTMGLPPSYDAVIINFDSTPPELLTLNHVITRLLNEETRQASNSPEATSDTTTDADEAMAVAPIHRNAARPSRAPSSDVTCFFCDGKGHFKSECPERAEWMKRKKKERNHAHLAMMMESDSDSDVAF
jgi:hypothetical protein